MISVITREHRGEGDLDARAELLEQPVIRPSRLRPLPVKSSARRSTKRVTTRMRPSWSCSFRMERRNRVPRAAPGRARPRPRRRRGPPAAPGISRPGIGTLTIFLDHRPVRLDHHGPRETRGKIAPRGALNSRNRHGVGVVRAPWRGSRSACHQGRLAARTRPLAYGTAAPGTFGCAISTVFSSSVPTQPREPRLEHPARSAIEATIANDDHRHGGYAAEQGRRGAGAARAPAGPPARGSHAKAAWPGSP